MLRRLLLTLAALLSLSPLARSQDAPAATDAGSGDNVAALKAENAVLKKEVSDAKVTISKLQDQLAEAKITAAATPAPAAAPDAAAPSGPQKALPLDSTNFVATPAAPGTPGAPATDAGPARSYTVVKGDSLWKIAHKMYPHDTKNGVDKLTEANKDQIGGKPLKIGMVLVCSVITLSPPPLMARKSAPANPPPEDIYEEDQDLLSASPSSGSETSSANEINIKAQRMEEQLLDLKRQQEEIARQKKELDELSRKQREFDEGRREIVEKLTRGLVLLEREEFEVKRELEQIKIVRDSFAEQLGQTENLNPAEWASEELPSELTKGLARVDQAKTIYSQSRARLMALRQAEEGQLDESTASDLATEQTGGVPYEKSIGAMVREGFFYSALPLGLCSVFLILAYILLHK